MNITPPCKHCDRKDRGIVKLTAERDDLRHLNRVFQDNVDALRAERDGARDALAVVADQRDAAVGELDQARADLATAYRRGVEDAAQEAFHRAACYTDSVILPRKIRSLLPPGGEVKS